MGFYDLIDRYEKNIMEADYDNITENPVSRILAKEEVSGSDLLVLISKHSENHIEALARAAQQITLKNFGKTIQLYSPMYVSNFCENNCVYCGFNVNSNIERHQLTEDEIEKEAVCISSTGIRHILLLSGGSMSTTSLEYIKKCVKILKKHFSSISIEIYPLTLDGYKELVDEGVDGLTIYQETYDRKRYAEVHLDGPKKDYVFRLDAPERAAAAGIRSVNIGALYGLGDWRKETYFTAMHAKYLQDTYPAVEISVSFPRMQSVSFDAAPGFRVKDSSLVQAITATRVFLPRVGITMSTRETSLFRDNLVFLGVTRMSAGSTTKVGGHTKLKNYKEDQAQFSISDKRGVDEMKKMISGKGYQPVMHDWMLL